MSFTWDDIKTEIEAEYDLSEETFMSTTELLVHLNDAVRDVEKEIHTIPGAEKYYESPGTVSLTSGSDYGTKPTDIYDNKITLLYYNDGSNKYEIRPEKNLAFAQEKQSGEFYTYRIENSTASGTRIRFYPTPSETSTSNVKIFYIRKAAEVTALTDVIDVPQSARSFIKQYIIDQAVNKERMTPDAPESAALKAERDKLVSILTNMIVDENNEVLADYELYQDLA